LLPSPNKLDDKILTFVPQGGFSMEFEFLLIVVVTVIIFLALSIVKSRTILPLLAFEICPVSSLTINTRASVISVSPIAAESSD